MFDNRQEPTPKSLKSFDKGFAIEIARQNNRNLSTPTPFIAFKNRKERTINTIP